MHEYEYYVCKSSWGVYVRIIAEYIEYDLNSTKTVTKISDNLWVKFAEKSLFEGEKFWEGDLPHIVEGLKLVENRIRESSKYIHTLIIIHSIQIAPCDFQEEGLTAAIIGWSSEAFGFVKPTFDVEFDNIENRYIFKFYTED